MHSKNISSPLQKSVNVVQRNNHFPQDHRTQMHYVRRTLNFWKFSLVAHKYPLGFKEVNEPFCKHAAFVFFFQVRKRNAQLKAQWLLQVGEYVLTLYGSSQLCAPLYAAVCLQLFCTTHETVIFPNFVTCFISWQDTLNSPLAYLRGAWKILTFPCRWLIRRYLCRKKGQVDCFTVA